MSYGKVQQEFWTDEKVQTLSSDGKLLALYLLTGPHRNAIGCSRIPGPYIEADMGWTRQQVADAIADLERIGFITRDAAGWTLINNLLRYDAPDNVNAGKHAAKLALSVPRTSLVYRALGARLKPVLEPLNISILPFEAPYQAPSKPLTKPIRTPEPSPEPLPEPISVASQRAAEPPLRDPVTPIDLQKAIWKQGLAFLAANGISERNGRGLIGRWLKAIGPPQPGAVLLDILASAEANAHGDVAAYVEKSLQNRAKSNGQQQKPTADERDRQRLADVFEGVASVFPGLRGADSGGPQGADPGSDPSRQIATVARST